MLTEISSLIDGDDCKSNLIEAYWRRGFSSEEVRFLCMI
jgi:hypothetical protein